MIARITWSPKALDELEDYVFFVSERNPIAALAIRARVKEAVSELRSFRTGRPGRNDGTFERYIPRTSLIMVYAVAAPEEINLMRFIHTSRDFRQGEWPDEG